MTNNPSIPIEDQLVEKLDQAHKQDQVFLKNLLLAGLFFFVAILVAVGLIHGKALSMLHANPRISVIQASLFFGEMSFFAWLSYLFFSTLKQVIHLHHQRWLELKEQNRRINLTVNTSESKIKDLEKLLKEIKEEQSTWRENLNSYQALLDQISIRLK